jgi:hypothetical protein
MGPKIMSNLVHKPPAHQEEVKIIGGQESGN